MTKLYNAELHFAPAVDYGGTVVPLSCNYGGCLYGIDYDIDYVRPGPPASQSGRAG